MSFFIRVQTKAQQVLEQKRSPVPNARTAVHTDGESLYLHVDYGATPSGDAVFVEPATEYQLADNTCTGGERYRFNVLVIKATPPTFALHTQVNGVAQWLSYNPNLRGLSLSSTVGEDESFRFEELDVSPNNRAIYSVKYNVYLTIEDVEGGRTTLRGTASKEESAAFMFSTKLGSGPLIPGERYLMKTIFGTMVCPTADGNGLHQSMQATVENMVTVESALGCREGHICYRFRTSTGRYFAIARTEAFPNGHIVLCDQPRSDTAFYLLADRRALGGFKVISAPHVIGLRADSKEETMTLAVPMQNYAADTFMFETVVGPVPSGVARRPIVLNACPRSHPELLHNKQARMPAVPKVERRTFPADGSSPVPRAASAVEVFPGTECVEISKQQPEEPVPQVRVVAGADAWRRWAIVATVVAFAMALLLVAQIVVSHNGVRLPLP